MPTLDIPVSTSADDADEVLDGSGEAETTPITIPPLEILYSENLTGVVGDIDDPVELPAGGDSGTEVVDIAISTDDVYQITSVPQSIANNTDLPWRTSRYVGLRFLVPNIPQGATIIAAHVQFTARATQSGTPHGQTWHGEVLDTGTFNTSDTTNVSDRSTTTASVSWSNVPAWTAGQRGADQRTPDLKTIAQEVVNHASFDGVIVFVSIGTAGGAEERVARSFDNDPYVGPTLTIEWES